MSITGGMDRYDAEYPYDEVTLSNKEEWSTDTSASETNFKNMPSKRSQTQEYMLYDSHYMKCQEKANA